jgi:hypothetical protein
VIVQIETIEPGKVRIIDELNKHCEEKAVELFGGNRSGAAEAFGVWPTSGDNERVS